MAEKSLPEAGLGSGATITTALMGVLTNLSVLVPEKYVDAYNQLIPFLVPILGFGALWLYNRFIIPPEMVSVNSKLEMDLKFLKKCLDDKYISEEDKEQFRQDYVETLKLSARVGRDFNAGIYKADMG